MADDPVTHSIYKRDLHFDFSKVDLHRWHPAGPQTSHFFNVQSLLFPQGERFFIRSVRHYRERIGSPQMQEQIAAFISQEAMHGREHDAYNAALQKIGYRADRADRHLAGVFRFTERTLGPKGCLAMTVALEHVTSIAAEDVLDNDEILAGAHPEMARLWRWHALEETEHKAVAFDVYREVAGTGFTAWLRRCVIMLYVSAIMQAIVWIVLLRITARSGVLFDFAGWGRLLKILWIRPGVFRRQIPRYWQFFRPGFHPWQLDNRRQMRRWQEEFARAGIPSGGAAGP